MRQRRRGRWGCPFFGGAAEIPRASTEVDTTARMRDDRGMGLAERKGRHFLHVISIREQTS
ncbi:hypothetical protein DF051_16495 [Burkholderia contaminans]|uniref:Uncharacterized protein n=1 Tax=Burkholderia contaminans TaxID=488447 RepID=A0A3N8PVQ0_9BURK|nr:hypothetical protein DF051_16495 [Burkholderia contaminans]